MDLSTILTSLITGTGIAGILIAFMLFFGKKWLGARIEESIKLEYAKRRDEHVDQITSDKILFSCFLEELPSSGVIEFVKTHDFGASYPVGTLRELKKFEREWGTPERCFLDNVINSKLEHLRMAISEFLDYSAENVFTLKDNPNRAAIPKEWRDTHPDKYRETVKKLNELGDQLATSHEDLVITARRMLKC